MRESLEINRKYNLKSKNGGKSFFVTSIVGYGASCIVYDAYYLDELDLRHAVRLKECCPINECEEKRMDGENIQWKNITSKNRALDNFEKVYRRHSMMQLQYEFVNVTSKIIDSLYEGNNTKYIVMECDNGQSFEKTEKISIYEKLKVLRALANTVKKYHEVGWLHLDLKPENFMIIPETYEIVKLFDFDSLVSLNALQEQRVSSISYSNDWAAPEVKQCKISKIGPAADVYSIGAILFYMLFKERVNVNSKLCHGNYIQPGCKIVEGVNPALTKRINVFLNSTLAPSKRKRYQDMDAVIKELDEMIHLADPSYKYLNNSLPIQTQYYCGREKEFDLAQDILDKGNLLIVSGIGGVGKTEFALNFANQIRDKYDCVIWGKYTHETLVDFLNDSSIFLISNLDLKESEFTEIARYVKGLLNKGTLLIIDDFNQFEDDFLQELLKVGADILVTTRINVEDYFSKDIIINLDCMDTSVLKTIFYHYYERPCEVEQEEYVEKLIERFDNYTLLIPILAKQMKASSCNPQDMWCLVEQKGISTYFSERIVSSKDQVTRKDYLYNHVKNIFDLSNMNEEERMIVLALSLLDDLTIEKKTLARWCSKDYNASEEFNEIENKRTDYSAINNLVELGWLNYDNKLNHVYMHDVIREVILYELKPSYENIPVFLDNILDILKELGKDFWCGWPKENYQYNESQIRWYYTLASKVLVSLDENNSLNSRYMIEMLEAFDDLGSGLKFSTAFLIYIKDVESRKLPAEFELKIKEWFWEFGLDMLKEGGHSFGNLSETLQRSIDLGYAVEDWEQITVYNGIKAYFRRLYYFIYKFDSEHKEYYKDFIAAFISLPDVEDIIKCLREIIIFSEDEEYILTLEELEGLVVEEKSKLSMNVAMDSMHMEGAKSSIEKEPFQEDIPGILDQIEKELKNNKRITMRMRLHLMVAIMRIRNLIGKTSNEYIKEIDPNLFFPNEDTWEYLKNMVRSEDIRENNLHDKILEMCELGSVLKDFMVYFDFSEAQEQLVDKFSSISGQNQSEILEQFYTMQQEYDSHCLNTYVLLKEIQERCIESAGFKKNTEYWDGFISHLLKTGNHREFLGFISGYCELLKETIIPKEISLERDTHMVQYLIKYDLELFALKLLLDIIDLMESHGIEELNSEILLSNYELAISLSRNTDNEKLYYLLKEKLRRYTKISLGYNEQIKFSANNVDKVSILSEYIEQITHVETVADRESIFEKLHREKHLDDKTKSILIRAVKDKESILNVVLNNKFISSSAISDEKSLNDLMDIELDMVDGSVHEKIIIISEICLQAILLNRTNILEEYAEQYISLQEQIFATQFNALDLMSYMTLPEILYRNDYEELAVAIFKVLDKTIQRYNIDECGITEKLLILPYLAVIYGALAESVATEDEIYEWHAKKIQYYELHEEIVSSL